MPGHAIFSNINDYIYGKTNQTYDRAVKRFGAELRKQKIIPRIRTGYIKNFIESEMTTEAELKNIFKNSYNITDYLFAEITIFNWE